MIFAGFFLPALAVGAGLGWLGGHSRRAAGSGALPGLLIGIGPGHNIPFLAGTRAAPLELVILAWVFLAASLTLVVSERVFARGTASARQSARRATR